MYMYIYIYIVSQNKEEGHLMIGTSHLNLLRFSHFLTSLQWTETAVTEEKLLKLHKNMTMRLDSAYIEVGHQRVKAE